MQVGIEARINVLHAARSLLETEGWVQGTMARAPSYGRTWYGRRVVKVPGGYCLYGAIEVAAFALEVSIDEVAMDVRGVVGGPGIPPWNDEPGRTKEEVFAAIDATIERLEFDLAKVQEWAQPRREALDELTELSEELGYR